MKTAAETSKKLTAKKRGNSKPNVKRRGDSYTCYVYVTDHTGRRRQHSKDGFKTQRDAEEARVAALASMQNGAYVQAQKITVAEFLVKEWLPSRKPPVLEESTWVSYERDIRLHVLPWIGVIPCSSSPPSISTSCTDGCSSPTVGVRVFRNGIRRRCTGGQPICGTKG